MSRSGLDRGERRKTKRCFCSALVSAVGAGQWVLVAKTKVLGRENSVVGDAVREGYEKQREKKRWIERVALKQSRLCRKRLRCQRDKLDVAVFHRMKDELLRVFALYDSFEEMDARLLRFTSSTTAEVEGGDTSPIDTSYQRLVMDLAERALQHFMKRQREECAGCLDALYPLVLDLSLGLDSLEPLVAARDWGPPLQALFRGVASRRRVDGSIQFCSARVLECLSELANWWMTNSASPVARFTPPRMWMCILSWISEMADTLLQEVVAGGYLALNKGLSVVSSLRLVKREGELDDLIFGRDIQSWRSCIIKSLFSTAPLFTESHESVGEDVWDHLSLLGWELEDYGIGFLDGFGRLLPLSKKEWCEWKRVLTTMVETRIPLESARALTSFVSSLCFEDLMKKSDLADQSDSKTSAGFTGRNSFRKFQSKLLFELWMIVAKGWRSLDVGGSDGESHLRVLTSIMVFYGLQDIVSVLHSVFAVEEAARRSWCKSFLDIGALLLDYRSSCAVCRNVMHQMRREAKTASEWLMAASRCISDGAFGKAVTLSMEDVVEEVLKERQFDRNVSTPDDLRAALHSLQLCKSSPSKLVEIGFRWERTGVRYDNVLKASEAQELNKFTPFQSADERHLSELRNNVNRCRKLTRKAIQEWSDEDVMEWSLLTRSMLNHNRGAFLESVSSQLTLRAEIAAVAIRTAVLFHSRKRGKCDWELRTTQVVAICLFFICPCAETRNKLCQISTGQGKSWILAILAACLVLAGRTVDIVMPSKELAQRDAAEFSEYFKCMKVRSACCCVDTSPRYAAIYTADVVYGDELNFSGDWLRSQFFRQNTRGRRKFDICLLDEVDNLLFDKMSHSVQIAGKEPGISLLNVVLAAMWKNLVSCFDHVVEDPKGSGVYYFVPVDFVRDEHDDCVIRTKNPSFPYEQCRVPIPGGEQGVRKRLVEMTETFARDLITPLSEAEAKKRELYNSMSEKLKCHVAARETLNDGNVSAAEVDKVNAERQRLDELIQENVKKLSELDMTMRSEPIQLPKHLIPIAERNISFWSSSALQALVDMKIGVHYTVLDGEIKVVDYRDTGTVYRNMVWARALHQFLQLKEGVPLTPLSPTKCFLSSTGFFRMYQNTFGMTGTLGDSKTKRFLSEQYSADLLVVPAFARVEVRPDGSPWDRLMTVPRRYAAKELTPVVVDNSRKHAGRILSSCTRIALCGRAVLLLVPHIHDVHAFTSAFRSFNSLLKVYAYTGEEAFHHKELHEGDIVVATNIAGRGEDFTPSDTVERNGGLHVCISFLPESIRVELQNAGRTCRQGRRGTVQMILYFPGNSTTVLELMKQRDETERIIAEQARESLYSMQLRDHLLRKFCALINEVLGDTADPTGGLDFLSAVQQARELWEQWYTAELNPSEPRYIMAFQVWRDRRVMTSIESKNGEDDESDTEALLAAIKMSLDPLPTGKGSTERETCTGSEVGEEEEFHVDYAEELKQHFLSVTRVRFPDEVLEEVFKPTQRAREAAAFRIADNKDEELESLKDAWGHWLDHQKFSKETSDATVNEAFDSFANDVRRMAAGGRIITNPHYYILKGNRFLREGKDGAGAALVAFDAALQLDSNHVTFIAHLYRAIAILANNGKENARAIESLQAAKKSIMEEEVVRLYSLLTLCSGARKELLVNSIIAELNFFEVLCSLIDNQITQLMDTKDLDKYSVDGNSAVYLSNLLKKENFPPSVVAAAESLTSDGLSYWFAIQKENKIPWRLIGGLVCTGLIFTGIGAIGVYYGGMVGVFGAGFISSGVNDIMDGLTRIYTRNSQFDLQRHCIQKVISITLGVVFHWKSVCSGTETVFYNMFQSSGFSGLYGNSGLSTVFSVMRTEFVRSLTQRGLSSGINLVVENFLPPVGEILGSTISSATQDFVSSNADFNICVDADVEQQGMRFELQLREVACSTARKELHTKRRDFSTGFQAADHEESVFEKMVNELGDQLLAEWKGGSYASTVKSACKLFFQANECTEMPSVFYKAYGKAIKPYGFVAKELLESVKNDTGGVKRDTEGQMANKRSGPDTSTHIIQNLCEMRADVDQAGLTLPSSASGFDTEKREDHQKAAAGQGPRRKEEITEQMCQFLDTTITKQITDIFQREMLPAISNKLSSFATNLFCDNMMKESKTKLHIHHQDASKHCVLNKIARGDTRKAWKQLQKQSEDVNKRTATDIREGKEVGLIGIAVVSKTYRIRIEVYNDQNELIDVVGECYSKNNAIQLQFINGNHYECKNGQRFPAGTEGEKDCLFSALLSGVPDDQYDNETCEDLRRAVANEVENGGFYYSSLVYRGDQLQPYRFNPLLNGGFINFHAYAANWLVMNTINLMEEIIKDVTGKDGAQAIEKSLLKIIERAPWLPEKTKNELARIVGEECAQAVKGKIAQSGINKLKQKMTPNPSKEISKLKKELAEAKKALDEDIKGKQSHWRDSQEKIKEKYKGDPVRLRRALNGHKGGVQKYINRKTKHVNGLKTQLEALEVDSERIESGEYDAVPHLDNLSTAAGGVTGDTPLLKAFRLTVRAGLVAASHGKKGALHSALFSVGGEALGQLCPSLFDNGAVRFLNDGQYKVFVYAYNKTKQFYRYMRPSNESLKQDQEDDDIPLKKSN